MAEPELRVRPGRLEYIDLLRFAAAVVVVCDHWLYNGISNGKVTSLGGEPLLDVARYGSIGVAVFFVISGFVISKSAHGRSASQFAVGRFVRLYPAFWVALIVTTIVATLYGAPQFAVSPVQFLTNLTMVPTLLRQAPVDGVYWTLMYELSFYVVIFVAVLLRRQHWFRWIFPGWALLMLVIAFVAPRLGELPILGNYYAFFVGGALLSTLALQGPSLLQTAGLLACVGTALRHALSSGFGYDPEAVSSPELATWLVLVVASFALVALVLIPRAPSLVIPGSAMAGALTYPVYLLHAHLGYIALDALASRANVWVILPMMAVTLLGASYALHRLIEVRLKATWRALGDRTIGRVIDKLTRD